MRRRALTPLAMAPAGGFAGYETAVLRVETISTLQLAS
jgi:hypothetical protein